MAVTPAITDRRRVDIYSNNLGSALRSAGRREFGDSFDTVPLTVTVSVPPRIAKDLEGGLLLQQVLLAIGPIVQQIAARDIAPFLTKGVRANVGAIEAMLRARRRDLELPIEAVIERHYGMSADWKSYRNDRIKEGSIVAVTLSLSVAAMAIVPFEPGISGAAAIIGLTRGVIDGALELKTCWMTASEAMIEADAMIQRLHRRHDRAGGSQMTAASQVAGAVGRGTAITKLGGLVGMDPLPSIGTASKLLTVAAGKIGHLYVFLDRMTKRLNELLVKQSQLGGSGADRIETKILALLENKVSGRRHGFRGQYTIADGFRQCMASRQLLTRHEYALRQLERRDPHAGGTAAMVAGTEAFTNVAMSAINYDKLFTDAPKGATHIFGFDEGQTKAVAASFGLFNDAVGALKEIAGLTPGDGAGSDHMDKARRDARLDFATAPSGLVPAGRV